MCRKNIKKKIEDEKQKEELRNKISKLESELSIRNLQLQFQIGEVDIAENIIHEIIKEVRNVYDMCENDNIVRKSLYDILCKYDVVNCDRCGKDLYPNNGRVKISMSDQFNNKDEYYWCKECYNKFITEMYGEKED